MEPPNLHEDFPVGLSQAYPLRHPSVSAQGPKLLPQRLTQRRRHRQADRDGQEGFSRPGGPREPPGTASALSQSGWAKAQGGGKWEMKAARRGLRAVRGGTCGLWVMAERSTTPGGHMARGGSVSWPSPHSQACKRELSLLNQPHSQPAPLHSQSLRFHHF